ncbi:MAG: response regulator [Sphingomonadales bacterium]|nr:response regulator [Sphingomonadales bacterium]
MGGLVLVNALTELFQFSSNARISIEIGADTIRTEGRKVVEWWQSSSADSRGDGQAMVTAASAYRGGSVRFMMAIDNFEQVALAYGAAVAARAVAEVRRSIGAWFGGQGDVHFEAGGVFCGTMRPASLVGHSPNITGQVDTGAAGVGLAGRGVPDARFGTTRTLINPPIVLMHHEKTVIALAISGSWSINDGCDGGRSIDLRRDFDGACRAPFFGELPQRGAAWAERYRADMAAAAALLEALARDRGQGDAGLAQTQAGAAAIVEVATSGAPLEARDRTPAEQLVFAWRPVRSAQMLPEVLFYEMCPQFVAADGRRRDMADLRPALERLGLSCAVDRYLVSHALDMLEAEPDLALAVQISAQSASACARWGGLFRRLTGSRSVARRLTLAITETASFPDFAEAIQFVSRVQAFGCAVAVDNFGLGYQVEAFDSGAALLERARRGLSGCIVLDVRMPGVSGLEVQRRLAALEIQTPVIVVSGFADIAMAVQAMKSNAFEFLTKPFRDQDLFDAIGAAMELDLNRASQSRERRQADQLIRNLTAREHEVFVRLCHGQLGKQIAHDLGMSEATVKVHRRAILHKLNVKHLGELILTYAPMVRAAVEDPG